MGIYFPRFQKARLSFFRVLKKMALVLNVTNLKYGKYDITIGSISAALSSLSRVRSTLLSRTAAGNRA